MSRIAVLFWTEGEVRALFFMSAKCGLCASLALLANAAISAAQPASTAPTTTSPTSQPTLAMQFKVEDVFYIKPPVDRVILVGTISVGRVVRGQKAIVHTANGAVAVIVESIDSFKVNNLPDAIAGEQVALHLTGIKKEQPARGDLVTADEGT
jgi:translation elongation factor EF-Tu-like GTPase